MCEKCPYCWSTIAKYEVSISKLHVQILLKIRAYCLMHDVHEFAIKDIDNELRLTKSEYATVNVLCRFGLLYRKTDENGKRIKWGLYGINMTTTHEFISKRWRVAKNYVRDVAHKTHVLSDERIFIDEIKGVSKFLTEQNLPEFVRYLPS